MALASRSDVRWSYLLSVVWLAACAAPADLPAGSAASGDNLDDPLLRPFRHSGKTDENGHPVNAVVVEGEGFCKGPGQVVAGAYRSAAEPGVVCSGTLSTAPWGDLILNVKLRSLDADLSSSKEVVRLSATNAQGETTSFTGRSFRADGQWTYLPVALSTGDDGSVEVKLETLGRGEVEIDYLELFPNEFPVVLGPGSRVFGDDDGLTIEAPLHHAPPLLTVNGRPIDLGALLTDGSARRVDTTYRSVYSTTVAALAGADRGDLDVFARDPSDPLPTARMRVYRAAPPCTFEGNPAGQKVLITGFDPFPVAGPHENVSAVAVRALDPSQLVGAQVMRLVLPVEFDSAPAIVADAILRCAPDTVIDFGQRGDALTLERSAYNLKDLGANPDNRGRFQAGVPIDEGGAATHASGLPLDRIMAALNAMEVDPAIGRQKIAYSDDPGRYVCNDTFYRAATVSEGQGIRAGFIHLTETDDFTAASRAAWGEIVRVIVQSAVQ